MRAGGWVAVESGLLPRSPLRDGWFAASRLGESGFELLVPLPVGSGTSSVLWLLVAEQPYSAAISPQPKICSTERCQQKMVVDKIALMAVNSSTRSGSLSG